MTQTVHYEDNLFFLSAQIKTIREGLTLDIDENFFIDKVVEDIFFIDATAEQLFSMLREKNHLIHRTDYLRKLMRVSKQFVKLLEDILQEELSFASYLGPFSQKFQTAKSIHQSNITEIRTILSKTIRSQKEEEDMVSSEEFNFLLQPNDEE
ncbi:MAG: hypothetical protein ACLFR1_01780 [Spirochaetia bacterium]